MQILYVYMINGEQYFHKRCLFVKHGEGNRLYFVLGLVSLVALARVIAFLLPASLPV